MSWKKTNKYVLNEAAASMIVVNLYLVDSAGVMRCSSFVPYTVQMNPKMLANALAASYKHIQQGQRLYVKFVSILIACKEANCTLLELLLLLQVKKDI